MNRPCMSRATIRWCSSATARRWAVGRASPVAPTRPARVAGPDSRALRTSAALSRTPTPPLLSMPRYLRLTLWNLSSIFRGTRHSGITKSHRPVDIRARRRTPGVRGAGAVSSRSLVGSAPLPAGGKAMGRTLAEKVWDDHVVRRAEGEPDLLYIDLHLLHEVTSPQAFDGLRKSGRTVRRLDLTIATEDHNTPTLDIDKPIADPVSRAQLETLRKNCAEFGVRLHPLGDVEQGVVHVVDPRLGRTQPGMTVVCGDSNTSTHGAFGELAVGIGNSQVEHVMATQTLPMARPKTMAITVEGELPEGVTAKDLILAIIARIGTGGGIGKILEYRGSAIRSLSMEGRMTVCNMSIEAGARAGLVAPDDTTFAFLEGRPHAPKGRAWEQALDDWRTLATDPDARFDEEVVLDATT